MDSNEFSGNYAQASTSLSVSLTFVTSASSSFIYSSCNIFVVEPIVLNMYDEAHYQI